MCGQLFFLLPLFKLPPPSVRPHLVFLPFAALLRHRPLASVRAPQRVGAHVFVLIVGIMPCKVSNCCLYFPSWRRPCGRVDARVPDIPAEQMKPRACPKRLCSEGTVLLLNPNPQLRRQVWLRSEAGATWPGPHRCRCEEEHATLELEMFLRKLYTGAVEHHLPTSGGGGGGSRTKEK